jgi:hypothetical protein
MPITSPGMALPASLPGALDTPVGGGTGGSVPPAPPPIVFLIRTPTCILLVDGIDVPALAFTASFGFDRHYSEASVTVGPTSVPTYWSVIELYADAIPRLSPTLRFRGRLRRQPRDLWPKGGTLACAGNLYRAALYKNTAPLFTIPGTGTIWPGGTDMVGTLLTGTVAKAAGSATLTGTGTTFLGDLSVGDVLAVRGGTTERRTITAIASNTSLTVDTAYEYDATGQPYWRLGVTDETQVKAVLTKANVPFTPANIGGTGTVFGTQRWDFDLSHTGPFTWPDQEPGLTYTNRIDEVSLAQDAGGNWGQYALVETLAGDIFRVLVTSNPQLVGDADFTLVEHVDLLEGSTSDHDVDHVANRIITEPADPLAFGSTINQYVLAAPSPYLPADVPNGPDGYPEILYSHPQNAMLEKRLTADPGEGMSAEKMAQYLLARLNTELVTAEIVTHRDDLFGPGQTHMVDSPTRLGITQRMWLRSLSIQLTEEGVFTQRLGLEVRN